jgi:molecular chaperone DnaK (HSP70)
MASGKKNDHIVKNKDRLSDDTIKKMIEDAEKYKQEDLLFKQKIDAKNELESYLANMQVVIDQQENNEASKKILLEFIEWFENKGNMVSYDELIRTKTLISQRLSATLKP